ncbi:MAG: histidyl-tRNA synthetase [Planctomycetota bacterium]|jgi:histidyl-tRNA synthetase
MSTDENKKGVKYQTARGMRDIMEEEYYELQGFFEKAQEISMYYGFEPIATPLVEHEELFLKGMGEHSELANKELYSLKPRGKNRFVLRPEATIPIMRSYLEHNMRHLPQPRMFYYYGPMFRHSTKKSDSSLRQFHQFDLEILGTEKPVADALIIQTAMMILKESGAKNLFVDINSIGDKDSRTSYERELKAFYRKNIEKLSPEDRQLLKTSPLRILSSKHPQTLEVNADAPDAVSYLTPTAKKHFKKVLEHLEELEIPYRINKTVVHGFEYYSHTVFEIYEETYDEEGTATAHVVCGGGRYNYLPKKFNTTKEVPGVGVAIGAERILASDWWAKLTPRIMKKPKIYFIQLGFDAKLKSLQIVELLRQAKIPILQSLSQDSLGSQLAIAESTNIPHTIIFGQREALDGTVIVRNMETRAQETVSIDTLVKYIRSLK